MKFLHEIHLDTACLFRQGSNSFCKAHFISLRPLSCGPGVKTFDIHGKLGTLALTLCNVYSPKTLGLNLCIKCCKNYSIPLSELICSVGLEILICQCPLKKIGNPYPSHLPTPDNLLSSPVFPSVKTASTSSMTHGGSTIPLGFFLLSRSLTDSRIHPISWSNHAPVPLGLNLTGNYPRRCHWQLNDFLLKLPETHDRLANTLAHFFTENQSSVMSISSLWGGVS